MGTAEGEALFLDTCVLLTATDRSRPDHLAARGLLSRPRSRGVHLALSGQVLREYLVVATRPRAANGLGLSVSDALRNLGEIGRRGTLLEETEAVSLRLRDLVAACRITGTRIHDTNIVATMQIHGVATLVTQNRGDFAGFPELSVLGVQEALDAVGEAP